MPDQAAAPNEAFFEYSNEQPAAMLWYHEHAMGITRLNAYIGLAGLEFVRDAQDTGKADNPLGLPAGPYEIPLVIQDKRLNPDGSLYYPTVGINAVHPIWVPEFFGDTPIINGTAYPFHLTEPRRYRFRLVNGSQARFYNLSFDNGLGPIPFHVIGMEQSLTPASVPLTRLLLAPGERADIIVDFAAYANQTITVRNNAKAPYPGDRGGEVSQLMQFRVTLPLAGTDTTTPAAWIGDSVYNLDGIAIDYTPIFGDPRRNGSAIAIDGTGANGITWAYASTRFWCTGAGSKSDPYKIEALVIDALNKSAGIKVRSSSVYYIIENCSVSNSSAKNTADYYGITLYLAPNGTVKVVSESNNEKPRYSCYKF